MVDNAWRDSFVVKVNKNRIAREGDADQPAADHGDNSSLLELERKANSAKPSGGDGIFAGTYFEAPTATGNGQFVSKGLSITAANALNPEPTVFDEPLAEGGSPNKERRGKSVFNRATQVLETFAERLSSGGEGGLRRKSSKEEIVEREKSVDYDRRKSAAPQRVKSVVQKITRATSRRRAKNDENPFNADADVDAEPESMYSSANPRFAGSNEA